MELPQKINKKKKELILDLIRCINDDHQRKIATTINAIRKISNRLKLSLEETTAFSICFSVFMDRTPDTRTVLVEIASRRILESGLKTESVLELIFKLERYGLIELSKNVLRFDFSIPENVIESINNNRTPIIDKEELTVYHFCDRFQHLAERIKEGKIKYAVIERSIHHLENIFIKLEICQLISKLSLTPDERLLYYLILNKIIQGDQLIDFNELANNYFPTLSRRMPLKKSLIKSDTLLIKEGFITVNVDNILEDGNVWISPERMWIEKIAGPDFEWIFKKECYLKSVFDSDQHAYKKVKSDSIYEQPLYFNIEEQAAIDSINQLLEKDRFQQTMNLLLEEKQRLAITILLSGPPGTGKTESVLQWARNSQRDLLWVDYAALSQAYVGESEKAVRKLFTEYRKMVQENGQTPILFINEADGLIGRRITVSRSVDQMSNAVQNILLEEMEKLNGILIATTNLTINMDDAFMRRFLFKIKLGSPNSDTRMELLKSKISFLSSEELKELSSVSFSGGQLENVTRKRLIYKLQHMIEPEMYCIKEWLIEETLSEKATFPPIGFERKLKRR